MTKRKMFLRMVTASLLRRRSRMLIALLSVAVGATILSGLVTIYVDVPRQMGAQFRSYGANMILLPEKSGITLTTDKLDAAMQAIPKENVIGVSSYRYVRLDMPSRQQSFTGAGTDFAEVQKTSPYFSVEGEYPDARREVLIGKGIADTIGAGVGSSIELSYKTTAAPEGDPADDRAPGASLTGSAEGFNEAVLSVAITLDDKAEISSIEVDASSQTENIGTNVGTDKNFLGQFIGRTLPIEDDEIDAVSGATISSQAVTRAVNSARDPKNAVELENTERFDVTGILTTGGEEESYIYMSLEDLQKLTSDDQIDVAELSVTAGAEELESYSQAIEGMHLGVSPKLVKRVAKSEAAVLGKLQALVFLVTAVVLLLTMICVSTTMMAVVSERRREIGLRKALGASDASIRKEFLGEGVFLGALGGVTGAALGFVFAEVVSVKVFGSSITFQPLLLPLAVAVSVAVSAAACQLPIKKAVAIDPAIVLKGE